MIRFLKMLTRKTFNLIGLDILRTSKSPTHSLLGLKNLAIKNCAEDHGREPMGESAFEVL